MLVILSNKSSQFIRDKVITDTKSHNWDTDLPLICYHLSMDFFYGRSLNKGIRKSYRVIGLSFGYANLAYRGILPGFTLLSTRGSKPGRPSKRRTIENDVQ